MVRIMGIFRAWNQTLGQAAERLISPYPTGPGPDDAADKGVVLSFFA